MSKRLFILAGEASGDRIGAALLAQLRQRHDIAVSGVGGDAMAQEGLQSLYPMSDLAVMGYADVIARLPLLLWRARQTARAILTARPDLVVLIDAQVFSQTVAKMVRKRGYTGKIVLYVAPAVWAWKPERAPKLVPLYDEVLAVLTFEPAAMARLGGPPTHYVGHPALARFPMRESQPARGPVILMPGSRAGELRRHLPLMGEVARRLATHPAVTGFVIPTPASQRARLEAAVRDWPVPAAIVTAESERQTALREAVLAFAVSGTATLELALSGVPHAITYIAEGAQVRLYKKATSAFVGLPNILAEREVAPELLFAHRADTNVVLTRLVEILDAPSLRAAQVEAFTAIRARMEKGAPEAPLQDPVDRIKAYL
jgi:lipid-A-disaccharide synthase